MKRTHIFISYFLIINLYLDLSLGKIDSFFLVLVLPFLFFKKGNGKLVITIMSLLFLYSLTCLFSGVFGEINSEIMSFMQFLLAMLIFFSLNNFSVYIDAKKFNDLVFKSFIVVSSISIVQFLKIDGGLIEHVRSAIHPDVYDIATEANRDELLTLSGSMRPLGLAKEPSYLSIFVVFCGYVIFTLGERVHKLFYTGLFIFYLYVNTSPLLGILFVILGLHYFLHIRSRMLKIVSFLFLGIMIFLCLALLRWRFEISTGNSLSWNFLYEVYEKGLVTTESSLGIRIYNPFITMYNVLSDNPLFGAGFANIDYIASHSEVAVFRAKNVLSNALASGFIYTGIVGMLIIFSTIKYQTKLAVKVLVPFVIIISFTGGGFFTIRFWSILFLFLLVYFLYQRGMKNGNLQKN